VFSPDGKYIVSSSKGNNILVWNTAGKLLTVLKTKSKYLSSKNRPVFTFNSENIITLDENKIKVWSTAGKLLTVIEERVESFIPIDESEPLFQQGAIPKIKSGKGSINYFTVNKKNIVTTYEKGSPTVWDIRGKQLTGLKGGIHKTYHVNFSPNGKLIVSSSASGNSKIWDLNGKIITELQGDNQLVSNSSFSPDGQRVLTLSINTASVWDLNGRLLARWDSDSIITKGGFSSDGNRIFILSSQGYIRIYQVEGLNRLLKRGCNFLESLYDTFKYSDKFRNSKQVLERSGCRNH
ncbi:MAG: hypothetical protein WBA39_17190, partial [Rivularia sp. (in: cyanobacteria)]